MEGVSDETERRQASDVRRWRKGVLKPRAAPMAALSARAASIEPDEPVDMPEEVDLENIDVAATTAAVNDAIAALASKGGVDLSNENRQLLCQQLQCGKRSASSKRVTGGEKMMIAATLVIGIIWARRKKKQSQTA